MYHVTKKWLTGWVILPCFTVKCLEDCQGADMTCNDFLGWIFEHIFAPFWTGKIHITGSYEE